MFYFIIQDLKSLNIIKFCKMWLGSYGAWSPSLNYLFFASDAQHYTFDHLIIFLKGHDKMFMEFCIYCPS